MSILSKPYFHDDAEALMHLEAVLWPRGPVCPHCGSTRAYEIKGACTRPGLRKCGACRKQFTVTVGTVFESSHVPLSKWLQAAYLLCSSKKGISSHQLHRILGVTYKTAWFMSHRLREAMKDGTLPPIGGEGGVVEADETYFGRKAEAGPRPPRGQRKRGPGDKMAVVALVERHGSVRTFHVDRADKETVAGIVVDHVRADSRLMTDESQLYTEVGAKMAEHGTVKHSANEYVRGDAHTNTVEGYFSIFKRGMKGVYQHCREKHLHRYLAEFEFRYNARSATGLDDSMRAVKALAGIKGKRLTYRMPINR